MKRIIVFFLLQGIAITGFSQLNQADWTVLEDSIIRVVYPSQWVRQGDLDKTELYQFGTSTPFPSNGATVVILIPGEDDKITGKSGLADALIVAYKKEFPNFKLVSKTTNPVKEFSSESFDYTAKFSGSPIFGQNFILYSDHGAVLVTFACSKKDKKKLLPIFKAIMDSFKYFPG